MVKGRWGCCETTRRARLLVSYVCCIVLNARRLLWVSYRECCILWVVRFILISVRCRSFDVESCTFRNWGMWISFLLYIMKICKGYVIWWLRVYMRWMSMWFTRVIWVLDSLLCWRGCWWLKVVTRLFTSTISREIILASWLW